MAEGMVIKPLDSIITIDGNQYSVHAETATTAINAEKLGGRAASEYQTKLISNTNIKTINGESILGSGNISISGGGGTSDTAAKVQVTMDNGTANATITIKSTDPAGGNVGDIWFKY